jgi:hypothetical protein
MKRNKNVVGLEKFNKVKELSKSQMIKVIGGENTGGSTEADKHKVKP